MIALNANRTSGLDFLGVEQRDHFFDAPNVVADTRFHRWRHAQGFMYTTKIIVHVVNGDRGDMVLNLFRVSVRQASEAAHVHPHGQVLPLNVTGRNVLRIGTASNRYWL